MQKFYCSIYMIFFTGLEHTFSQHQMIRFFTCAFQSQSTTHWLTHDVGASTSWNLKELLINTYHFSKQHEHSILLELKHILEKSRTAMKHTHTHKINSNMQCYPQISITIFYCKPILKLNTKSPNKAFLLTGSTKRSAAADLPLI